MSRYLTVVFQINDEDAFKEQQGNLHAKMLVSKTAPWSVSAMSLDDEMTRLDMITKVVESYDDIYELRNEVDDILSKVGVNK